MSPILVTGGAGFIGAELVRQLLGKGETVVTVDKLGYASSRRALAELDGEPRHELVVADVADEAAMQDVIARTSPRAIVHLAAESHVDRSIADARAFIHSNVVGTHVLLECARRYWEGLGAAEANAFRFLQVSTDEVFGTLGDDGCFDEASRYDPRSPYAASKAAADHLVRAWWTTYGLPALISYGCNSYGPRQHAEKLIPCMIARALARQPLGVYGTGDNVREWIHVSDHARALVAILSRGTPGESYAVSSGASRRNIDLVRELCAILDEQRPDGAPHASLIAFVADRPGHDYRYALDSRKLRRELGWEPRVSLSEGLRDTVRWYLDEASR